MPASPLSATIVAVTSVCAIEPPLRPTVALSAIAKHDACEAAISSSGLVLPPGSPTRDGNDTGNENAPLPAFAVPLPSMIGPVQSTTTLRENVAINHSNRKTPPRIGAAGGSPTHFLPFAVTASWTRTPIAPSASAAAASQRVFGIGSSG